MPETPGNTRNRVKSTSCRKKRQRKLIVKLPLHLDELVAQISSSLTASVFISHVATVTQQQSAQERNGENCEHGNGNHRDNEEFCKVVLFEC